MTLFDYMTAGNEVVTDKISTYVDKDIFNNLLKMSYGSMELIPPPDMVTTYTDTVLAINKYKYDTLLASATAKIQSGTKSISREEHSGTDTDTLLKSGTIKTVVDKTITQSDEHNDNNTTTDLSQHTGTDDTSQITSTTTSNNTVITTTNTGTQTTAANGAITNSVGAYDGTSLSTKDKQDSTNSDTRTDDLTSTTSNGGDIINSGSIDTSHTINNTDDRTVTYTAHQQIDGITTEGGTNTQTNDTTDKTTTAHGHIINTEHSEEYNSPEYIAAMRGAAMFSLAKIIAVDITAAICVGVW